VSPLPGYARLVELAERRLALLEDGRIAEAVELGQEQFRLIERLPLLAPPEAEPFLRRLAELFAATAAQLQVAAERTAHELGALRRTRPALLAYVGAPERPGALDGRG
jgi:hypothetical protein